MAGKTLVVGASVDMGRYSNRAIRKLIQYNKPVIAYGKDEGEVAGIPILNSLEGLPDIDTVTLYVNPLNQRSLIEPILGLNPKRIIFNPGTENPVFEEKAREKGIQTIEGCTLVMLAMNTY